MRLKLARAGCVAFELGAAGLQSGYAPHGWGLAVELDGWREPAPHPHTSPSTPMVKNSPIQQALRRATEHSQQPPPNSPFPPILHPPLPPPNPATHHTAGCICRGLGHIPTQLGRGIEWKALGRNIECWARHRERRGPTQSVEFCNNYFNILCNVLLRKFYRYHPFEHRVPPFAPLQLLRACRQEPQDLQLPVARAMARLRSRSPSTGRPCWRGEAAWQDAFWSPLGPEETGETGAGAAVSSTCAVSNTYHNIP